MYLSHGREQLDRDAMERKMVRVGRYESCFGYESKRACLSVWIELMLWMVGKVR